MSRRDRNQLTIRVNRIIEAIKKKLCETRVNVSEHADCR